MEASGIWLILSPQSRSGQPSLQIQTFAVKGRFPEHSAGARGSSMWWYGPSPSLNRPKISLYNPLLL